MSSWYDSLLADFCLTVGFASIDLQYRCKFRSVYKDRDGLVWTLEYRLRSRVDSGSSIGGSASSGQLCLKFWFITMPIHLSLALRPSYWFPSNVPAWCSRCLSDGGCSQSMPCYVCPTRFLSIPCWIPYKHWPAKHGLLENPPFGSMIVPFTSGFPDCPGLFFLPRRRAVLVPKKSMASRASFPWWAPTFCWRCWSMWPQGSCAKPSPFKSPSSGISRHGHWRLVRVWDG